MTIEQLFADALGRHRTGDLPGAATGYRRILAADPAHADAMGNLGATLFSTARRPAAAAFSRQAALAPNNAAAQSNFGLALKELERIDAAMPRFERAIALDPAYAEAYYNNGLTLKQAGRLEEAARAYALAIRLRPRYPEAAYDSALVHLLLGHLDLGWDAYEWRLAGGTPHVTPRRFAEPAWRGEPLAGRTLLLHAEQGFGDSIQFCRYAVLAARLDGKVILAVPALLQRLLRGLGPDVTLARLEAPLPPFDLHCPLMSAPLAFKTTLDSIPAEVPYLSAEPERVAFWRQRLGQSGFKVGIVWQGKATSVAEKGRSAPLALWAPLAGVPGVRLISLQMQHGLDQLDALPAGMSVETLGPDFNAGPDGFIDSAAVMANLDLVISVCTATAHLAGALGRPLWIALRAVPHWVWMMRRRDSPWYPTARLFRQTERGAWEGVFQAMAVALADLVSGR